jgi:hypothetical protein
MSFERGMPLHAILAQPKNISATLSLVLLFMKGIPQGQWLHLPANWPQTIIEWTNV